jgi:hypothetical protein
MFFYLCESVFALGIKFSQFASFPGRTLAEVFVAASGGMEEEPIGGGDETPRGRGVHPHDGCTQEKATG